jgi:hypothetical protein
MPARRKLAILVTLGIAATGAAATGSPSSGSGNSDAHAGAVDVHRLPLGDNRYLTRPKKGYVFSCITRFGGGGAFEAGAWIDASAGTWDLTRKIAVQGSVGWPARFSNRITRSRRRLSGNGLPPHRTGTFPVAATDPAYQIDRNPNSIRSYTLRVSLPRKPKVRRKRTCVGGTIGVMKSGVPLYSAFDAGGRDAVAHEVQDACDAHPQMSGQYHYHSLSRCLSDTRSARSHSRQMGWALDGFGIYGLRGSGGKLMSTADLDSCHGHSHRLRAGGRRTYHYHATLDFPYVVSCYRGKPITAATGLGIGGGAGQPPPGAPPPGAPMPGTTRP